MKKLLTTSLGESPHIGRHTDVTKGLDFGGVEMVGVLKR